MLSLSLHLLTWLQQHREAGVEDEGNKKRAHNIIGMTIILSKVHPTEMKKKEIKGRKKRGDKAHGIG